MAVLAFSSCFLQPNLPPAAPSRSTPSLLKSPFYCNLSPVSSSSSSYSPSIATEQEGSSVTESSTIINSEDSIFSGCQACGKAEVERGCNGEGRIQGGIATVPGFGWWPIKAFRPCPEFVASGGRYKRRGQSMDEVTSGRGRAVSTADVKKPKSSKKKAGS